MVRSRWSLRQNQATASLTRKQKSSGWRIAVWQIVVPRHSSELEAHAGRLRPARSRAFLTSSEIGFRV